MRTVAVLIAPIAAILMVNGAAVAVLLFGYGAATPAQAGLMGLIVSVFMLGLLPFTLFYVLLRGYYALEDTRTPFWITVGFSVLLLALAYPLFAIAPRAGGQQVAAIALAYSLSYWAGFLLAWWLLARRLGSMESARTAWVIVRTFLAAAIAVGVMVAVLALLPRDPAQHRDRHLAGPGLAADRRAADVGRRPGRVPRRGVGDAHRRGVRRTVAGAPARRSRPDAWGEVMRATEQLGRYRLLDLVTQDPGLGSGHEDVYLWHGYDEVLDRPVAMRVLSADDPRTPAVLGAAQAAALVDDRRLLRVLDILDLPASSSDVARVAVVSEWASGRNLERTIEDRHGTPFAAPEALSLVAEVARAIAAGRAGERGPRAAATLQRVHHRRGRGARPRPRGRRRPVRPPARTCPTASRRTSTRSGRWCTCSPPATGPVTPRSRPRPPRATARSCCPRRRSGRPFPAASTTSWPGPWSTAARARGVARVPDPAAFATMVGAALDHVAPVSTTTIRAAASPGRRRARTALIAVGRLVAVVVAAALVARHRLGRLAAAHRRGRHRRRRVGHHRSTRSSPRPPARSTTCPAAPSSRRSRSCEYRSYDPFGDDDGNGKPDKRKGRESEELAITVNDDDPDTAWLTSQYTSADLDGKEGVGLILDLGQPQDIQQVSMNLIGAGLERRHPGRGPDLRRPGAVDAARLGVRARAAGSTCGRPGR